MKKTFDGHVIGEIIVDEGGIYKVIDTGDEKSYSVTTLMPRETFIEAYNKYIKDEVVEERPQGDCISRSALKDIAYINKGNFNTVEGIREWIDNAPTVNTNAIADNEKSQGDLISREALRKEVTEKVNFTTVDGHIAYDKMLKLIDNAQAVDLWQMRQEATENALKKAEVLYARPKGEWIELRRGIHVTDYKCSCCGRTVRDDTGYDVSKDYPFCHCGADMRGGADNEKTDK